MPTLLSGFMAILVDIDCLSKGSIFIPTTDTVTAISVADVFVTHIFTKHGILCTSPLITDQNSHPTFSALLDHSSPCDFTSCLAITPQQMCQSWFLQWNHVSIVQKALEELDRGLVHSLTEGVLLSSTHTSRKGSPLVHARWQEGFSRGSVG